MSDESVEFARRLATSPADFSEPTVREWLAWTHEPVFPGQSAELRGGCPIDRGFQEMALERLQNGRCAICGRRDGLVLDHDYYTGLTRGLLCRSCNVIEGTGRLGVFETYRRNPPAGPYEWIYQDALGYTPPLRKRIDRNSNPFADTALGEIDFGLGPEPA